MFDALCCALKSLTCALPSPYRHIIIFYAAMSAFNFFYIFIHYKEDIRIFQSVPIINFGWYIFSCDYLTDKVSINNLSCGVQLIFRAYPSL